MTSVNVYLRENLSCISSNISVAPQINEKKLNNAVKSFGFTGNPSTVVALYDNTLFGSAKEGILFTGEQLIYRRVLSDPISMPFASIASGMLSVGFFGGFAVGPPAFGWFLAHSAGFAAAWLSLIGILVAGGLLCLLLLYMRHRE